MSLVFKVIWSGRFLALKHVVVCVDLIFAATSDSANISNGNLPMDTILDPREQALLSITKAAGEKALALFNNPDTLNISMKGPQDWLTYADGAVEAFIRQELRALFPHDAILGEEEGGDTGEHLWIIDPIDGTANFARRDRFWCVSIGFAVKGVPMLGAIFAPALDEFYSARTGRGAMMNGQPIHVAHTASIDRCVVEIGWNIRLPNSAYLDLVNKAVHHGASVKRCASGALAMTQVAIGRTDCYAEAHINSWDVLAGLVIAQEAGARCNDFASGNWAQDGNPIFCAQPVLYDALKAVFAPVFDK
jgi:myo-inositol-1(or 4)-monophosphatase